MGIGSDEYYVYCYECDDVKSHEEMNWDGNHYTCKEHPFGSHRELSFKQIVKTVVKIMDKEQKIEALTNGL